MDRKIHKTRSRALPAALAETFERKGLLYVRTCVMSVITPATIHTCPSYN